MASSTGHRRPIIGVLIYNKKVITRSMRGLVRANKKRKLTLHFFTAKDVDFEQKKVQGMYYDYANKRWKNKDFPLPDILYARAGSGLRVSRTVKRFDALAIPRLNPVLTFNKGELFQKLANEENLTEHLPYTQTLEDLSEAETYIEMLGDLYIKACIGRRGLQVMRVVKRPGGGYSYSYSILGKLVSKTAKDFKSLAKVLGKFFGKRKVLVQQAIDLIRVGDQCAVDLRGELQRNGKGELKIVAIPIRVGRRNSPITTHGSAYKFDEYLQKLFPNYSIYQLNALKQKIHEFLFTVYRGVEKHYGVFAEVGIDFALDNKGQIWLLECNAQSAKVSVEKAYGMATKIHLNVLEYAKRLSKRVPQQAGIGEGQNEHRYQKK